MLQHTLAPQHIKATIISSFNFLLLLYPILFCFSRCRSTQWTLPFMICQTKIRLGRLLSKVGLVFLFCFRSWFHVWLCNKSAIKQECCIEFVVNFQSWTVTFQCYKEVTGREVRLIFWSSINGHKMINACQLQPIFDDILPFPPVINFARSFNNSKI